MSPHAHAQLNQQLTLRMDVRGNHLIDDRQQTLLVINPFGLMDWLACGDLDPGLGRLAVGHEVHLSGCRGVQLYLVPPMMLEGHLDRLSVTIAPRIEADATVVIDTTALSGDGCWRSHSTATLRQGTWHIAMQAERLGTTLPAGGHIELTDMHPGDTGRGILLADRKRFSQFVISDRTQSESYPHQHSWHSGEVLYRHHWSVPTAAMFCGDAGDGLEMEILATNIDPAWTICDMYYDLHLFHHVTQPITPGTVLSLNLAVRRVPTAVAAARLAAARPIAGPVAVRGPRIGAGRNHLTVGTHVDRPDETHLMRIDRPEQQRWSLTGGRDAGGLLHLSGGAGSRWELNPPIHLRPGEALVIEAWVRGGAIVLTADAWTWHWPSAPGAAPSHGRVDRGQVAQSIVASNDWTRIRVELPAPQPHEVEVTASFGFTLSGAEAAEICAITLISS